MFTKSRINKDKKTGQCKNCRKLEAEARHKKNKENPEYLSKLNERSKDWYEKNKDKASENNKEYRSKNKDRLSQYGKEYKAKPETKDLINNRNKIKRKNNVNFKISSNYRSRLKQALKNKIKTDTSLDYIGCSVDELKIHLEGLFVSGMSWSNYGKTGWHIDHIRPCCSFDLSKEEEIKECFHYTNLQPLWAEDNLEKGGNYY